MSENQDLDRDPDDPSLTYRPIHGLAVTALVLALFGLLTIAFPLMMFLNLVASVLAIFAIVQIRKSDRYMGQKIAQMALFLAILAATFSIAHNFGRSWYLKSVARQHSRVIADLIMNGRFAEAFEYTLQAPLRKPRGTDLEEYYRIPESATRPPPGLDLLSWVAQPPLSIIDADNGRGKLIFRGYGKFKITDPFSESITCIYKYEPDSPELQASTFQMIFLRRDFGKPLGIAWRLYFLDILAGPQLEKKMIQIGGPPPAEEE